MTSFEVSGLQNHNSNPPVHALSAVSVFEADAYHNLWCAQHSEMNACPPLEDIGILSV